MRSASHCKHSDYRRFSEGFDGPKIFLLFNFLYAGAGDTYALDGHWGPDSALPARITRSREGGAKPGAVPHKVLAQ